MREYEVGTKGSVVRRRIDRHDLGMLKRVLAALLWFYAGWYAGNVLADLVGVSMMLGPIIGAAAAALVAGDPRRIIWTARNLAQPVTITEPTADPV